MYKGFHFIFIHSLQIHLHRLFLYLKHSHVQGTNFKWEESREECINTRSLANSILCIKKNNHSKFDRHMTLIYLGIRLNFSLNRHRDSIIVLMPPVPERDSNTLFVYTYFREKEIDVHFKLLVNKTFLEQYFFYLSIIS